jgi:hypothetical protein
LGLLASSASLSDAFVLFVPFVVKKKNANNRLHLRELRCAPFPQVQAPDGRLIRQTKTRPSPFPGTAGGAVP